MKKPAVVHPFLLAAYPVLFLYAHNIEQISINALILPLLISICLALVCWLVLYYVVRDTHKVGFILSIIILLFFSYGHLNKSIAYIFLIWPAILCVCLCYAVKTKISFQKYTYLVNVIALILLAFPLIRIVVYHLSSPNDSAIATNSALPIEPAGSGEAVKDRPNIFFIILDAYARNDVLRELYDYDNSEFLEFLTRKGFYIAHQARANYCQTALTFASCLNMTYLNDLVGSRLPFESGDRRPLWEMIRNSAVLSFLKQRGYSVASFSSATEDTDLPNADIIFKPGLRLNKFQHALINTTPIPTVLQLINSSTQFDLHRKDILFTLEHLDDVCTLKTPMFVFAHIEAPHPPFVFGPQGEGRDPEVQFNDHDGNWLIRKGRLTREAYLQGYVDQLIYLNKKVKSVIESILTQSERPPVIILASDHGPRSMLVWDDPEKTYMRECMAILNGYYLPGGGSADLYAHISLVNTFRVIFNRYFGTEFEILRDESFFSTAKYCYQFTDVTDRINKPNREIIHLHLGRAAANQGKVADAISHFSEVLQVNPNNAEAHIGLSAMYAREGQYLKQVSHLKQAIRLRPKSHIHYNNLGVAYLRLNQVQKAAAVFKETININPEYVPALLNLGDLLSQQGQLAEAIRHYEQAVEIQPNHPEAYNSLGVAYARQGRLQEAVSCFSEALRLEPGHERARRNLKIALQQSNRSKQAESSQEKKLH